MLSPFSVLGRGAWIVRRRVASVIIKSLSRKQASFQQLLAYFHQSENQYEILTHNMYADGSNWNSVADEFLENSTYLTPRANGVSLYHEILALPHNESLSQHHQAAILLDLAEKYLLRRAPHQLAYGRVHTDTDHVHLHLAISSNTPRSYKRVRLSKAHYRSIQHEIEEIKIERYAELGCERLYDYEKNGKSFSRETLRAVLEKELFAARSHDEMIERFASVGYQLYQRGKSWGVQNRETNQRHRLKTVGLEQRFEEATARFSLIENRTAGLAQMERGDFEIEAEVEQELTEFIDDGEH